MISFDHLVVLAVSAGILARFFPTPSALPSSQDWYATLIRITEERATAATLLRTDSLIEPIWNGLLFKTAPDSAAPATSVGAVTSGGAVTNVNGMHTVTDQFALRPGQSGLTGAATDQGDFSDLPGKVTLIEPDTDVELWHKPVEGCENDNLGKGNIRCVFLSVFVLTLLAQ